MLEKHKNLIEKNILNGTIIDDTYSMIGSGNGYSFKVVGNELKIFGNDNVALENVNDGSISIWKIENDSKRISIIINKVDSLDVVAMIAIVDCNNDLVNVSIKLTPTNLYISYDEDSINYDVNKCNSDLIINTMEDYFNKKGLLNGKSKEDIFNFIRIDIDEIFTILNCNKNNYINNLEHQLNNLSANYVMESEKIKRKINTLHGYETN